MNFIENQSRFAALGVRLYAANMRVYESIESDWDCVAAGHGTETAHEREIAKANLKSVVQEFGKALKEAKRHAADANQP